MDKYYIVRYRNGNKLFCTKCDNLDDAKKGYINLVKDQEDTDLVKPGGVWYTNIEVLHKKNWYSRKKKIMSWTRTTMVV